MDYRKIIPCLDVKNGRLVKGVHFTDLQDIGNPAETAQAYSEAGADEIVFFDITASLEGRTAINDVVRQTIDRIKVPLTVGGGIASCGHIEEMMNLGVSKVSINTAAVERPQLIREAAMTFGPEKIVIALDTRRNPNMASGFEVIIKDGTAETGMDAVEWAKQVDQLGAGSLTVTSVDTDGTQQGYDIEMVKAVTQAVTLPVIAAGGAGEPAHIYQALTEGCADAVLVSSIVHFGKYTIGQLKEYLARKRVSVTF